MMQIFKVYKNKFIVFVLIFLFALNVTVWQRVFAENAKPDLSVSFLDVGQGDAIFIESRDGTQILVDGGPNSQILSKLSALMDYYDRKIDLVILTHPHADHVSGLVDVLNNYEVGSVLWSGVGYNTAEAGVFERILKEKNIKQVILDKPAALKFYDEARIVFLYPDISFDGRLLKNVHDSAVVFELKYQNRKILFTGDAEKKLEDYLVKNGNLEDVDVFKVGHHGSKTSSNIGFLNAIKPEYSIISVGKRNRYGHPAPEALGRLAAVSTKIFRTDLDGTITLKINDGQLSLMPIR